ncbi:hypothetical protein, partial [Empedobacter sp. UBA2044]|uniref:hypothetical protein n=1 Tax=Empedobacter sp. UBA2044 TaxID=1946432 RepID=UPI0025C3335E
NNASKAIQSLLTVIASITNVIASKAKQSSKQRKQSNPVIAHRHCEQREAIHKKTQHIAHVITSNAI